MVNKELKISNKKTFDIHKRIYDFVIRVVNLTKSLPKTPQNERIIPQIIDSATSMGANDREADGALTKKDFIHCYTIVRKEGKETVYWLEVISDINPPFKPRMKNIIQEGKEIVMIVSSIIQKTKKRV